MLHKRALSAQRTHGLLPQPIRHALPAEHVPTCRDARVFHRFQTKRTFPLLLAVDPLHGLWILEVIPVRFLRKSSMRDLGQPLTLHGWVGASGCVEEKRCGHGGLSADLDAAVNCCACGCAYGWVGRPVHGLGMAIYLVDVQIALHDHLKTQKNTEDLVADSLLALL